jgi:hypothetical protein
MMCGLFLCCVLLVMFLELFNWWLKSTSTCRKFDGRHVKFARERVVVCCRMVFIVETSARVFFR